MKTTKPLIAGLAIAAAFLTACGGGGGSTNAGNPSAEVSLSGSAAKGALIGADVNAYEILNGVQSKTLLAHTTTDATGSYTLKASPTNNPVIVEIVANANTMMLDETQIETDGSFKKVEAPKNLTLRTFVSSMSEGLANVQANPITEAAVAMANASVGADKKLSLEILTAAKQVALQMAPSGTNPFSDKPALKATEMTAEQTKFSAMMAGMIKSKDASCDLPCQVGKLSKDIKIEVATDGKGTISPAAASAIKALRTDLLTQGQMAWLDDSTNSARLGSKLADVRTAALAALSASTTNTVATSTASLAEVTAAEGLEGFIKALRDGFRATEKNLLTAKDELNAKYKDLSLVGSQDTMEAIDRVKLDCFKGKTTFACARSADSHVTWTQNGDTWTGKATNSDGSKWEGTVSGSIVSDTVNSTMNATTKSSEGKLLTQVENLSVVAHNNSASDAGSFNVNGIIKAYADNGLVISLAANNLKGTIFKTTDTPQKGALAGEVILSASNGDMLKGTLAASGDRRTFTHNYCSINYPCIYTERYISFTAIELHLTAINNNSQLLKLDVTGSQTERNKSQPESASNFTKVSGDITAILTQSLTLNITGGISDWSTEKYAVTISSGGSEVNVSGIFTISEADGGSTQNKWCPDYLRCAKELSLTTGNNVYSAKLTRLNGKPQGDILKGTTKVGVIKDGIIQINGRDVSIY